MRDAEHETVLTELRTIWPYLFLAAIVVLALIGYFRNLKLAGRNIDSLAEINLLRNRGIDRVLDFGGLQLARNVLMLVQDRQFRLSAFIGHDRDWLADFRRHRADRHHFSFWPGLVFLDARRKCRQSSRLDEHVTKLLSRRIGVRHLAGGASWIGFAKA